MDGAENEIDHPLKLEPTGPKELKQHSKAFPEKHNIAKQSTAHESKAEQSRSALQSSPQTSATYAFVCFAGLCDTWLCPAMLRCVSVCSVLLLAVVIYTALLCYALPFSKILYGMARSASLCLIFSDRWWLFYDNYVPCSLLL